MSERSPQWILKVHKLVCAHAAYPQQIFCERVAGLAEVRGGTSSEMAATLSRIGLAISGQAGAHLSEQLAGPASPITCDHRYGMAKQSSFGRVVAGFRWIGPTRPQGCPGVRAEGRVRGGEAGLVDRGGIGNGLEWNANQGDTQACDRNMDGFR